MEKVLVTGGAGFAGSSLAIALRNRANYEVIAFDNLKRRGSELNLARLREHGVQFVHGDVRCMEDLEDVGRVDWILECSAEPSVLAGYTGSPCNVVQTNLVGMLNCLEWARRCHASILFLSTSRVYPISAINDLPYEERETRFDLPQGFVGTGVSHAGISEDFPLQGVRSLYGATKLTGELMMAEYLAAYGLRGIINRCGLIAGPWQMGKTDQGVVALWAARHIYEGSLTYIGYGGTGKQVRDMLHIDDLTRLVEIEMRDIESLSGEVFNVGGGRTANASLQEMTLYCREACGKSIPIMSECETRAADIRWYLTNHSRITAATGWAPEHDARAIIVDVVRWITDHREALRPVLGAF
ncbi:MAG TPA: NAD-dependent epimerase/dehydratase family protein [Candidatus Hydrogenedentes bacterium]|nr:NAD-dependent epimerase/dehydratase family protein [Candidatus Hydrogenedentota bacterium]HOL75831.1 NAD-dependent epimerase/dehydratase family protein [Candidatus Hydrogenedentota bacterium]HPO86332.1 NAD-dependent epimerase/dehydratase family protein [Candidatus Hydrogenedentota bacterium]